MAGESIKFRRIDIILRGCTHQCVIEPRFRVNIVVVNQAPGRVFCDKVFEHAIRTISVVYIVSRVKRFTWDRIGAEIHKPALKRRVPAVRAETVGHGVWERKTFLVDPDRVDLILCQAVLISDIRQK